MIAVVQRAAHGSCTVDGKVTGSIGKGLVILLGVMQGDTDIQAKKLAARCVKLRCFTDENDKMNLAVKDVGGSFLVISQFTLCADTASGNRPSFSPAAKPWIYSVFQKHSTSRAMNITVLSMGVMRQVTTLRTPTLMLDFSEAEKALET